MNKINTKAILQFFGLFLMLWQLTACGENTDSRGIGRVYGNGKSGSVSNLSMKSSGFLYNENLSDYSSLLSDMFQLDSSKEPMGKVSAQPNPNNYGIQNGAFFWLKLPNRIDQLSEGDLSSFDLSFKIYDDYGIKNNNPISFSMNSKNAKASMNKNLSTYNLVFEDEYGEIVLSGEINGAYFQGSIYYKGSESEDYAQIDYFYINTCYLHSSGCSK